MAIPALIMNRPFYPVVSTPIKIVCWSPRGTRNTHGFSHTSRIGRRYCGRTDGPEIRPQGHIGRRCAGHAARSRRPHRLREPAGADGEPPWILPFPVRVERAFRAVGMAGPTLPLAPRRTGLWQIIPDGLAGARHPRAT